VKITQEVIDRLNDESLLKEHQDEAIAGEIASATGLEPAGAMRLYYDSRTAALIADGSLGLQYLDASVLAEMVLEEGNRPPKNNL